jgi:hypothetical protein
MSETMGKHRRLWSMAVINADMAAPSPAEPRHVAGRHVHVFQVVAEFTGIRAALTECECGAVKTLWRTDAGVPC